MFTFSSSRALALRSALFALVSLPLHSQASEQTQVYVSTSLESNTAFTVSFDAAPRVSQLVSEGARVIRPHLLNQAQAHQSELIYWQGASLFSNTLSDATTDLLESVKADLHTLSAEWADDAEYKASVDALIGYIEDSTFRERLDVPLDEDFYLMGSRINPLANGDLTLILPRRPEQVTVIGAVVEPKHVPFATLTDANGYLAHIDTLNTFGISEVAVVAMNGELANHKIAYWNGEAQNIPPGAVIFVPFQRLPFGLSSLNEKLPRLLQHRVM
ncbi:polysaccharide synthesis [Grimontia sp. S25]|uniref:Polysaccharide synthesis n=1 Tax=Grimontia sedimenti TaxID=2711294 RepID=A0A6M1RDR2_9GAMM|nr:capsule biosynthesis GfcC family protein [Grimontia sedimenti]NGN98456.1 polysaccharide synthesis [Grimontia sedimenti]